MRKAKGDRISRSAALDKEVQFVAIRAQGAGGQNVGRVSNAVHLHFDIEASSVPRAVVAHLRNTANQRISSAGIVMIKAQRRRVDTQVRRGRLKAPRALAIAHERGPAATRKPAFVPTHRTRASRPFRGPTTVGHVDRARQLRRGCLARHRGSQIMRLLVPALVALAANPHQPAVMHCASLFP